MNQPPRDSIAVIGNASIPEDDERFDLAFECGRRLMDADFRLVTGGLGGVMEAACRGARESTAWRDGDIVGILPGLDPEAANPYVDIPIATGLQMARNIVVANSEAVVAIGGGAGTLSEIAYAWQLRRPIIALETSGWSSKLAGKRLDKRDRKNGLPQEDAVWSAATPTEAVELVCELVEHHNSRPTPFGS